MRAADYAHIGRKAGHSGDLRLEGSERVPGLAHRRKEPPPAHLVHHAREIALVRPPQVGVRSERGCFRSHSAAQAPSKILRIGQERGRLLELSREMTREIENVPPEIEAPRQTGRPRLVIGRPRRVVGGVDSGESIELIVERRKRFAVSPHEDAGAAVGHGRDRLDGKTRAKLPERVHQERPGAFRVELEIRPRRVWGEGRVGAATLGYDLALGVEHDDLHVRLADVENRDAAVHARVPVHSRWNISTKGVVTGLPSGLAAMMSFMCAHQRRMIESFVTSPMRWSSARSR